MTTPIRRTISLFSARRGLYALAAITCMAVAWAAPAGASAATSRAQGAPVPSGQNTSVAPHPERPAGFGGFEPEFDCKKPGTSHSVSVHVDLSGIHVTHSYDKKNPTELKLDISGSPKFTLNIDFEGSVECSARALTTVPLGESGLELKIGPKFEFSAEGKVGAEFTWQPTIDFGFTLNRHGFTDVHRSFANGGGIDFSGKGSATLSLGVDAIVQTDGGLAGLEGVVGPVITTEITADSAKHTSCWKATAEGEADFSAFVKVFHFLNARTKTYKKIFDEHQLANRCNDIIFDGSPGTGAPPATLGPYPMQAFGADPTAEGTAESKISGPTGTVKFDSALTHALVGSDWQTWSNGYSGDVYEDLTELKGDRFEITVTLPDGTGAFYAYAEPNLFKDFDMDAIAADGPSSGEVTVHGKAGAKYFGFYATCGHKLKSITFTDSGGDTAMAIGEFGIAPASACKKTGAKTR